MIPCHGSLSTVSSLNTKSNSTSTIARTRFSSISSIPSATLGELLNPRSEGISLVAIASKNNNTRRAVAETSSRREPRNQRFAEHGRKCPCLIKEAVGERVTSDEYVSL